MIAVDTALRELPGIGPTRSAGLAAHGLETAWDLLHAPPRCLGPPPPLCEQGEPEPGQQVRLRAQLLTVARRFTRGRGLGLEATLVRHDGRRLRARFWRAAMLIRLLVPGSWFLFEGIIDQAHRDLLLHPSFTPIADGQAELPAEPALRVAYRLPPGLSQRGYAKLVDYALAHALPAISDPAGMLDDPAYQAALLAMHRPDSAASYEAGRSLLAYRELLALAWQLQERRRALRCRPGRAWRFDGELEARLLAVLPFTLTAGQRAALAELRADLGDPQPMYRLLHGEVGCGKTALALLASLAVIAGGGQVLWLAPTAVLARQHADFCLRCLDTPAGRAAGVALGLLTGGTPAAERSRLLSDLAGRRLALVIGTHALLDDALELGELGLLVIDEQHKFGVAQRAWLLERVTAGQRYQPDLLLMTATPIPRTLALTSFGDLALTRIADRPPGRSPVTTELCAYHGLGQLDQPVRSALDGGGRCLVICAARHQASQDRLVDVGSAHRHLCARFAAAGVGLLHGALGEGDKLALMAAFAHGRLRVLVATSVVEVGIDVAEATLLAVLDSERFGLAQLHQLRGRLGRGTLRGRCLLFHRGPKPSERLGILAGSDDGLAIAAYDLAQRGAGELLGTAQHGTPMLRIAELARDGAALEQAHAQARRLLSARQRPHQLLLRLLRQAGGADGAPAWQGG